MSIQSLIGKRFPVLDYGFVELMEVMGSEAAIVEAARVTAQSIAKTFEDDVHLLRYLMRHRHSTPYEMAEAKFRVHVPMDCWRQWIRHRTANVNEYSTRYTDAIDEAQMTQPNEWRLQAESNRQGSSGFIMPTLLSEADLSKMPDKGVAALAAIWLDPEITVGGYLSSMESALQVQARHVYEERRGFGVAREQARKDLPLSTYTEAIWKCDVHNLLHFLGLRMDEHAQYEIRQYATVIGNEIMAAWMPNVWQAFLDYRMNAVTLTALDVEVVQTMVRNALKFGERMQPPYPHAHFMESQLPAWQGKTKCRERDECFAKLQRLSIIE